jgi:uncharacterized membrane protein YcaP (DUF421 family)
MFFDGWQSIARVVLLATGTYVLLIAALRVAGTQALAKMSAYDLVITIALGSIVATIPLGTGVTLADGAAVIVSYLGLQAVMRRTLKAWLPGRHLVKNAPRLVVWDGRLLDAPLRQANVTDREVRAAIRKAGIGSVGDVQAVVLENDGEWSVIGRTHTDDLSALAGVTHA